MPVCWLGVIREYEPIKPPIEEPDEPITTPSTDDIIKTIKVFTTDYYSIFYR